MPRYFGDNRKGDGMKMRLRHLWLFVTTSLICGSAFCQTPSPGQVLLGELRAGGLILFFRHAHADVGEDQITSPDYWKDCTKQRMLSAKGQLTAHQLGIRLRGLSAPVSRVISGDLCRAQKTAEMLQVGKPEISPNLNDYNTWKAQGNDVQKLVDAYRSMLSIVPAPGTNVVLVSHAQRGRYVAHPTLDLIEMGTVAIFRPNGSGGYELRATVRPGDWDILGYSESMLP